MLVRTRFAPSPTGFLHVGSARTALFAWLYAKQHQGQFVLRIEDTDSERSTDESIHAILESMKWLGLTHDEGPFYQTDNYKRYVEVAHTLIEEGQAYRCDCSKARLEALREAQLAAREKPRYDGHCRNKNLPESDDGKPYVIRFKNPSSGMVSFHDEVYGDIQVDNQELDDLVLIRSDGNPTYNFAVVIDDWDMNITHVIRGDDHINNTPRQINLYKALKAPIPVFAHLPMILGDDGKRLSKRHGAVGVMQFRDEGFLPHALLNYLVRLGWSHGDQELFRLDEMIADFDLKHVSRGVSSFNYDKLNWVNQHYLKTDAPADVARALAWHFSEEGIDITKGPALADLVEVQAERCKTLKEMCEISRYFYTDDMVIDMEARKKHLRPVTFESLSVLYERLKEVRDWEAHALHQCIIDVSAQFSMNMGKVAQPLRVAITGTSMSPSIDKTMVLLGRGRVLSRLHEALDWIKERMTD
jgi:glutamyl-tRNA synthetase